MKVLVTTSRNWHLGQTARAFSHRHALAGLWMADKNATGVPAEEYRRCWPYHLAMKPLYHTAPEWLGEPATYHFVGLYERWLRAQLQAANCPKFEVVHGLMGFSSALFAHAKKVGALRVLDCANSHPVTYYGFWQRECDLWSPGYRVPIPRGMFARMNREIESADVVLCPSNFVRDSMLLNGVPAAKCFVNPFGVNTSLFRKRESLPAKPRFICVGGVSLRKGHPYLFRAFERVRRQLPEAELICVGTYKRDFHQEKAKWLGTFTHYPALLPAEVASLLRECSAFVLPSQEEGFARALIEALASGLPVVASPESGATTLMTDGAEGFIVRGRDPEQIAAAMLRLVADPELNRRMGEAAYKQGAASNNWQDYGDRLLAEYERRLRAR